MCTFLKARAMITCVCYYEGWVRLFGQSSNPKNEKREVLQQYSARVQNIMASGEKKRGVKRAKHKYERVIEQRHLNLNLNASKIRGKRCVCNTHCSSQFHWEACVEYGA